MLNLKNRFSQLIFFWFFCLFSVVVVFPSQLLAQKNLDLDKIISKIISPRTNKIELSSKENIQEAIDSAPSNSTIIVPPGIYYENIVLKPGITLKSQKGPKKTIFDGQGQDQTIITMAENSVLEGFTLSGRGDGDRQEKKYMPVIKCDNVSALIKGNIIKDNLVSGIQVHGEKAAPVITENKIPNNLGAGIGNDNGSKATIYNNQIHDNSYAGIGVEKKARPWIIGNKLYLNHKAGVGVRDKDSLPKIEDNEIYSNNFAGIGIQLGASSSIINNHLTRNNRAGVGISKGSVNIMILDNKIEENIESGIGIIDASTATIKNNLVAYNKIAGITIMDHSNVLMEKNRIINNVTSGIITTASEITIKNNRVVDNQHHGIAIHKDTKGLILKNYFNNNGGDNHRGTGIMAVTTDDITITRNIFKDNFGPGVYARRCAPKIIKNKFVNDDILARNYASPWIEGNFFDSNGKISQANKGGINCRDHGHPVIINNTFCGRFAIFVRWKSNPLIVGNIFTGTSKDSIKSGRSGIKISTDSSPIIRRNLFYNGNGIRIKTGLVTQNLNAWEMNSSQVRKISRKGKSLPVVINENLFLEM